MYKNLCQVCSGDILQFGVDVMENSRKVRIVLIVNSMTVVLLNLGYPRMHNCNTEEPI